VDRLLFVDRLSLLVGLLVLPASVRLLLQDGPRVQGLLLRPTYSSPPRHSGTSTTFIIIISLSRLVLAFPATRFSLVPTLDSGGLFGVVGVVMVMVVTILTPTTPRLSRSNL
jgi:hypothetical protein